MRTLEYMLTAIDTLVIHDSDYNILLNLINNLDSKLFIKVMEEILEGQLFLSDFEPIFGKEYTEDLEKNIIQQKELEEGILRFINFRKSITSDSFSYDPGTDMIGIMRPSETSDYFDIYSELSEEEISILQYHIFDINEDDDILKRAVKNKIRDEILLGTNFDTNDLLLFANEYIVPINMEHQILNKNDKNFMIANNLTEEEVKKMKALAIYLRRKES